MDEADTAVEGLVPYVDWFKYQLSVLLAIAAFLSCRWPKKWTKNGTGNGSGECPHAGLISDQALVPIWQNLGVTDIGLFGFG